MIALLCSNHILIHAVYGISKNLTHLPQTSKDFFRRRKCRLQPVELFGKALNGVEEFRYIHIEGNQHFACDNLSHNRGIIQRALRAEEEEEKHGYDIQHIYHRTEDTEDENLLILGFFKGRVSRAEFFQLFVLAVKELRNLDTRKIFGQEGVDVRRMLLYLSIRAP